MELQIEALNKRYGSIHAVRDFTLRLDPGMLGLLGPNGAGKSTLMRMLATITQPTSGRSVSTAPTPKYADSLRRTLGYLPQDFGIYPHLSALEFLEYLGALKASAERLKRRLRRPGSPESYGCGIARLRRLFRRHAPARWHRAGVLNEPRLFIVDEPTAGLDPEERVRFRTLLREMAGDRIIVFSTHIAPTSKTWRRASPSSITEPFRRRPSVRTDARTIVAGRSLPANRRGARAAA